MKLSRTVTYAVQATMQLASRPRTEPVPCSQLAAEGNMPERFLLQILRNLVTHGILNSTRGVEGGYSLGRRPDEISLLDVIEAIDGPMSTEVAFGEGMAEELEDRLRDELQHVTSVAREQLEAIKMSRLIRPPED